MSECPGTKSSKTESMTNKSSKTGSLTPSSCVRLSTSGVDMPVLGLGLSHNGGGDYANAIRASLSLGIRHFDTAARYGTESVLGQEVKSSTIDRGDLFITTKLWPQDADDVANALRKSLSALQLDYVDCYLIHWPGLGGEQGGGHRRERQRVWREMERLLDSGRAKSIGVSNFLPRHLNDIVQCSERATLPDVNQVEFNPLQQQPDLLDCNSHKIQVVGYSPLAKGAVITNKEVNSIAERCGCSAASAALRWSISKGVPCIPKAMNVDHIKSNVAALGLDLPEMELRKLDRLHENFRCTWDPSNVP